MEPTINTESKLRGFIERMPKAELHLHFDSINPDILIKVAKRNGLNLPYRTHAEALKWHNFKDLEEFLGKWLQTVEVMLTEEDYFEADYDLVKTWNAKTFYEGKQCSHIKQFMNIEYLWK